MEYEKNIEEMAEVIESELKVYFGAGDVVAPEDFPYQARGIAESLAKKGYRKESDTAIEILDEAKKWVKAHYKDKVTDSFGEREMLFMEAFGCLFEYLKEKYNCEVKQ